jgi:hypothetical protein
MAKSRSISEMPPEIFQKRIVDFLMSCKAQSCDILRLQDQIYKQAGFKYKEKNKVEMLHKILECVDVMIDKKILTLCETKKSTKVKIT